MVILEITLRIWFETNQNCSLWTQWADPTNRPNYPRLAEWTETYGKTKADWMVGVLLIALVFEAARRVMGWGLPLVCLTFLLYALFGQHLPGALAHRGYGIDQVVGADIVTAYGGTVKVLGLVANDAALQEQFPAIAIYYCIASTLQDSSNEEHYHRLVGLLAEHSHTFPEMEVRTMYDYAQNYCIKKIKVLQLLVI